MNYGASMLLAPAIALLLAWTTEQELNAPAPPELMSLRKGFVPGERDEFVSIASLTSTLWQASFTVLLASLLVPILYYVVIRTLGSNRDVLARHFPWLTRCYLALVVLLLAAQAGVVALGGAAGFLSEAIRSGFLLIVIGAFAVGLLASAGSVLSDLSRALAVEPVQVTAVLAGPELDVFVKRVQGIAQRLGVSAPDHILVGIEPNVFATAAPVRLRGNGELHDGTTLYLPMPLLRTLSGPELDALLARELSCLNESAAFTGKLVPISASVTRVTSYVEREGEQQQSTTARFARIPASGFLAVMQGALRAALRRIREQRETEADRIAAKLIEPKVLFSALSKVAALNLRWQSFRHAYELYMLHGQTRRNLSLDFLAHVAQYVAATGRTAMRDMLVQARIPHAFDVNDTLTERATKHSIQIEPIILDVSAQLTLPPRASSTLASLEAQVTKFENEYFHVPGRRVAVNQDETLPAELASVA
jgi:Zn-dependent protease with chaperone function